MPVDIYCDGTTTTSSEALAIAVVTVIIVGATIVVDRVVSV